MSIDVFTLGLTFILMHEMDAMRCHEWRIFPGISLMNDRAGMITFIFLHIPLFYLPLSPSIILNESFRTGCSIFFIVHVMLHLLFLMHKKNEFKDWISWSLILGAGICGGLYLVINQ
ncbi:MAG: DUF6713 family protein [Bacteroidota bacterium]